MAIQQHKFTAPVSETVDVARIKHFTYHAVNNTLSIAWEIGEDTGTSVVKRGEGTAQIDEATLASYPNVVADLESLVSRMLNYLEGIGEIPAGTQEDAT